MSLIPHAIPILLQSHRSSGSGYARLGALSLSNPYLAPPAPVATPPPRSAPLFSKPPPRGPTHPPTPHRTSPFFDAERSPTSLLPFPSLPFLSSLLTDETSAHATPLANARTHARTHARRAAEQLPRSCSPVYIGAIAEETQRNRRSPLGARTRRSIADTAMAAANTALLIYRAIQLTQ